MAKRVEKWEASDGRLFDTFTDATNYEQRNIQIDKLREVLERQGESVSEDILGYIADYIITEFEPQ